MKIICSTGPKTSDLKSLLELYQEGMNCIRFNFSHIHYDTVAKLVTEIRQKMPEVELIQDLQGQKLRVSKKFRGEVEVNEGEQALFCTENQYENFSHNGKTLIIPVSFEGDFSRLAIAKIIYMKDATMEFEISAHKNSLIYTTVKKKGIVRAEKGINAPGMDRVGLGLSQKDKEDIEWGKSKGFDILCLSFVTCKDEVLECRELLQQNKKKSAKIPRIWAKIETKEGLDNFEEILDHADGIMLGRGDLTAEQGMYDIPYFQNKLLKRMQKSEKEFVVATYFLESMRYNPVPSLAECCDIWNCLSWDVSGVMLTAEVGVGKYSSLAVRALKKIMDNFKNSKNIKNKK